jgi:uncharacterized protein (TIGR03032 family)
MADPLGPVSPTRDGATGSVPFHFAQDEAFASLLRRWGASVWISTYQANKLIVVRSQGPGISALVRHLEQPMGIAIDSRQLSVGTKKEVWSFRNAPDLARKIEPCLSHDACFVPRSCHVTGDIGIHEMAWGNQELWVVNTRFSCLCTLTPEYSFVPRWSPVFISALAAEDRCHLNGLAMVDDKPRFVTALGESDKPRGWRANKAHGGCVIDIASGEFVARGLCMPHSPRWANGRLWFLESGTGTLIGLEPETGRHERILQLPGFARGLAIHGDHAFVGLSKIRPTSAMDGVPLSMHREELRCGVAAIDLKRGAVLGILEFQTAVEEIFDVQLLLHVRFPEVIGFQKEAIFNTFVVP